MHGHSEVRKGRILKKALEKEGQKQEAAWEERQRDMAEGTSPLEGIEKVRKKRACGRRQDSRWNIQNAWTS